MSNYWPFDPELYAAADTNESCRLVIRENFDCALAKAKAKAEGCVCFLLYGAA